MMQNGPFIKWVGAGRIIDYPYVLE
jgi:hypothetical protein